MKRLLLRIMSGLAVSLLSGGTALAYSLSNPAPGFGPAEYQNLISTTQFTFSASMDASDVANFLGKQGYWSGRSGAVSWMHNYAIPEYQNVLYKYNNGGGCTWASVSVRQYNDVTSEPLYGYTVAQLIAKEARDHGINPGVMLATLEKESSAITTSSPLSDAVEKWVLGYGWNDQMAACGYNQAEAEARAVAFGGVGQQIAYATAWFQSRLITYASNYATPFTTGDGATISAANPATRALYAYTPYVYNGNYNFWNLFNSWFSPVPYRPLLVIKRSTGAIYILTDTVRYPIDSMDTLHALGLTDNGVRDITAEEEAATSVGPLVRRLLLNTQGGVSYLINGRKHPIASARTFELRGFRWEDISPPNPIADLIPSGLPYYELAKMPNSPGIFIMTNNRGYAFPDPETYARDWGFRWDDFATTPTYTFAPFPLDGRVTRLVKGSGPAVYLMDGGKRLPIQSAAVFNHWSLSWGDINQFDDRFVGEFPQGRVLGQLAKGSGPAVYLIQNGRKQPFASAAAFTGRGYRWQDVVTVSDALLGTLATGSTIR